MRKITREEVEKMGGLKFLMKQVKIIESQCGFDLQTNINKEVISLYNKGLDVLDIKFSVEVLNNYKPRYFAMIIYEDCNSGSMEL